MTAKGMGAHWTEKRGTEQPLGAGFIAQRDPMSARMRSRKTAANC